jgi:hypothetical protein
VETQNKKKRLLWRRVTKVSLAVVGGVIASVIIVVLLLLLPAVRERILSVAVSRASGALPGSITVGEGAWPSLGSLELRNVLWHDSTDTLAAADRVAVSVSLRGLLGGDIDADHVEVEGASVNIPAITSRVPSGDKTQDGDDAPPSWPRDGSLPGVPSMAVDRLNVTAKFIRLSGTQAVTGVEIVGGFDCLRNHPPKARIERFALKGTDAGWTIDELSLDIDIEGGRIDGKARGALSPQWPVFLSLTSTGMDSFELVLANEQSNAPPDAIGAVLNGKLSRDGANVHSIIYSALVTTPGLPELREDPALAPRLADFPDMEGLTLRLDGSLERDPALHFATDICVFRHSRLDTAHVTLRYAERNLSVDRLFAVTADLGLDARGRVHADSIALQAVLDVRRVPGLEDVHVRAVLAGDMHRGTDLTVRLSPIDVLVNPRRKTVVPGALAPSPTNGRILYTPQHKQWRFENVQVTGDAGAIQLAGSYAETGLESFDLACSWRSLPPILLEVVELPADVVNAARLGWPSDAPFSFSMSGDADTGRKRIEGTGTFVLPGPRNFKQLLPDSARVEDLGPFRGRFEMTASAGEDPSFDVTTNLDATT